MKKWIKLIMIILVIGILLIILDTIQAKVLNHSPIIKVEEVVDGVTVDKGILVDTYIINDTEKTTVFKWEDYEILNKTYTNDDLKEMTLDYFINHHSDTLPKEDYSVGISEEVPEIYQGQNLVVIEISQ